LNILEVSLKLGIPRYTLRFWESEFRDILIPLRTQGMQRRYTPENIFIITQIKKLREQGKSLREIKWSLRRMSMRKKQDPDPHSIDLLADRIAEVVRAELYKFFTMEDKEIGRS